MWKETQAITLSRTRLPNTVINGKEIKYLENTNTERDLRGMKRGQQIICELVMRYSRNNHSKHE